MSSSSPAAVPAASSSPVRSLSSFPFSQFSLLLSRVSDMRRADKLRRVRELFHHLGYQSDSAAPRPNLFPLLRLLLPQLDTERATYGLRESSLAEVYIAALSLDRSSHVALRLRYFKQPQPQHGASPLSTVGGAAAATGGGGGSVVAGDFASVLLDVLRPREVVASGRSKLTIADVNQQLDDVAASPDRAAKQSVFVRLIAELSASEHFWVVRVILKDLKVGLKHDSLLRLLHPLAVDVYNSCSSLRHVCELLCDPGRLVAEASNVGYFRPFKPMLAQNPPDWHNIPRMMDGRRYVIEDKFDGERLIVHKRGGEVKLYTRKSIDVTHRYGYGDALAATLLECIAGDAIVDGELMSWDITLQKYVPFGNNRTTALLGEHTNRQLTYLAFDLIMDGDTLLIDRPLVERKRRLQQIVVERQHAVEVVPTKDARPDNQYLLDHLNDAVYRGMEGLVLKAAGGQYALNDRSASWIKFKPDFVSGLHDTLDLLLEGTRRGGDISHFLLAVVDKASVPSSAPPRRFYTFCKVGSGYTIPQLNELRNRLRDKWKSYDKRRSPPWLLGWRPEPGDVPDVVIEPRDSIIVEIKCYEIIPCPASKFLAEFTCRFPRVTRFRYDDKEWHEAESIDQIRQLAAQDRVRGRKMDEEAAAAAVPAAGQSGQSLSQDGLSPHSPLSDSDAANGASPQLDGQWGLAGQLISSQDAAVEGNGSGGKKSAGRKRGRRQATADESSHDPNVPFDDRAEKAGHRQAAAGGVLPLFQPASGLSVVERRSSLFAGLSVVVMVQPDCQPSKAELERLIVQHGGEVRQNPPGQHGKTADSSPTHCVLLSDGRSSYKLQAHQRSGRFDIVHFSWVTHCIARGRLGRYKHEHIISATAATASERSRQVDRYGDDYTEDVQSIEDIRLVIQAARQSSTASQQHAHSALTTAGSTSDAVSSKRPTRPSKERIAATVKPPPLSPTLLVASSLPSRAAAAATATGGGRTVLSPTDYRNAAMRPRLFDGVHAIIAVGERQPLNTLDAETMERESIDAAIVRCALLLNGAEVGREDSSESDGCGAPVTHCISLTMKEEEERDEWQEQALRVIPAWVTDSFRIGNRQSEANYSPQPINVTH